MRNKFNYMIIVFIFCPFAVLTFACNESLAGENTENYIEINIFNGYFLIPNSYTFNVPLKKHAEDTDTSSFSQYEKINEPFIENPGVISMGHISACEVCMNPSILSKWNVKHQSRVIGKLTILSAAIMPPESKNSTEVIFIFDKNQFMEFMGGNLEFIEHSVEYFQN